MGKIIDKSLLKAKCINDARIDKELLNIKSNDNQRIVPKPIFVVGLPHMISQDNLVSISKTLELKMPDYHVICHSNMDIEGPVFKAFFPQDFDEVAFEELKEQVLNNVGQ